jgi:hypothetical protein
MKDIFSKVCIICFNGSTGTPLPKTACLLFGQQGYKARWCRYLGHRGLDSQTNLWDHVQGCHEQVGSTAWRFGQRISGEHQKH